MSMRKVEDVEVNNVAREVVTKVTAWRVAKSQAEAARVAKAKAEEAARVEAERVAEAARLEALRNTPEGYIKAVREAIREAGINLGELDEPEFIEIDNLIKQQAYDYFYGEAAAEVSSFPETTPEPAPEPATAP